MDEIQGLKELCSTTEQGAERRILDADMHRTYAHELPSANEQRMPSLIITTRDCMRALTSAPRR